MPIRKANAVWEGDLKNGKGRMAFGGGAFEGAYNFGSRFEEGPGTNPEELIAAAHAGCYSMALSNELAKAGFTPTRVATTANVHLEMLETGPTVTRIVLKADCEVPGIDQATFDEKVEFARTHCPISRLLKAAQIEVQATLKQ
ncbi:MAG TPA: OsmC family protein [Rhodothermales bacterium]